jgi:DNA-binding transcriptional LysR family regulator
MQTVIGLVAASAGVSLVPASVRALQREGVTYRPLQDGAPAVRLEMAWRRADESAVLAAFTAMARAEAPAEGERGRRGPALR